MGRQVYSHSQDSRAPLHIMVTREDKHHHSRHLHFLLLSPAVCAGQMPHGLGHPLGNLGSPVLTMSPPSSLCTLMSLTLSSINPKHSPKSATEIKNSTPAKTSTRNFYQIAKQNQSISVRNKLISKTFCLTKIVPICIWAWIETRGEFNWYFKTFSLKKKKKKKNPNEIMKFSTNLSRFITFMKPSLSDSFDFTTHSVEVTKHISFSLEHKI